MKASKKQLRRIIREEKRRLLSEQPISGAQAEQMAAAQKAANDVSKQGSMIAELDNIVSGIETVAKEMYGLMAADPSLPDGEVLARELEVEIERLNVFYEQMEAYFTAITSD